MPTAHRNDAQVDTVALPLFVPADRPERIAKAVAALPDAVIIDLEDAVAPDAKAGARSGLAGALRGLDTSMPLLLRINAAGTPWHEDDVAIAGSLPLAGIVLPKAGNASDILRVGGETGLPVVALIESALGISRVDEVAGAARRIAFGSIDYAADLAIGHTRQALADARARITLASRLAGLCAPIDGVTAAVHDAALLADDCAHAREMGFGGKLLIHPAQIAPARAAFLPSDREIGWARRVLHAAPEKGAFMLGGEMVDAPVLARARQILARVPEIALQTGRKV
ncbi:CoA ester lyase [Nitratireductor aquimarinus]|uniref:HpcH/HpaI aldolase/citrate lyase family protein n=1 Tax=Nitratireductor aquimarinus TaxID=889300 RepID=UPI001A8C2C74|nr:CoA ester lyase [Nitratireductor aquimarinus]MBN8245692.1 CoA ester lyase [Nitratireductor aquimarinus]MBY6134075.1 CoA ester lyase [Nitratireductor aquimarinus]MCA1305171.1 CoA ester lyase [Nitratireductor aquimarinus]